MISCSNERLEEKITTFSKYGDTGGGGITRLCFTEADLQARAEFCRRCEGLGMEVKTDDMGNIYSTFKGSEDLPAIAVGSHTDSVVKGGNYDGILGVLTGLEAVETIIREGIKIRHPLTVLVWTNEEGSRFPPATMASGVITGKFDMDNMLKVKDSEGVSFQETLETSGYFGAEENRFNSKDYKAFIELHVEQGPVLVAEKKDIGVVDGALGMVNFEIITNGQANHAGTTPMPMRKDALYAMAEIILYLHRELDKLDSNLVYTTGEINAYPNVHTVIPDKVRITLESRHKDAQVLKQVVQVIESIPMEVHNCQVSYREQWRRKPVVFNPEIVSMIESSVHALDYSYMYIYSGAGHDAQFISDIVPTAMIFVPSEEGFSHCEDEFTTIEHCWKGANVLLHAILGLDKL